MVAEEIGNENGLAPAPLRGSVLLVDDEPLFRNSMAELLRASGFYCEAVDRPLAALESVGRVDFDVCVVDLVMEGEPQLDFLRRIASCSSAPGVILVTAHPSVESAVTAFELGLLGYLPKPVEAKDLIKRIDEAIERKRFASMLTRTERSLRQVSDSLAFLARMVESGSLPAREPGTAVVDSRLAEHLQSMTPREQDIVGELLKGYRLSTIARRLGISMHTVRRHLKSIFLKLEVRSQAELLEKLKP